MTASLSTRRTGRIVSVALALIILAAVLVSCSTQAPHLILTGNTSFSVGEEVTLSRVVSGVENGSFADENALETVIPSDKEGAFEIKVAMVDPSGQESEQTVLITFVRTAKDPVITAPEELDFTVSAGVPESIDLLNGVSAADEDGKSYPVTVEGDYDLTKVGDYTISFVATSDDGKRIVKGAVIHVNPSPFGENGDLIDGTYKTVKGFELIVKDGLATIDGIMIVNKSYSLPKGFSSTGDGTRSLRPECEQAWYEMRSAAPSDIQAKLKIKSAVRNIADQTYIFNNYVAERGLEAALTFSARPRHSEHHTGLAMDLVTASSEESRKPETAAVLNWLDENAYKYGFIKRYPEGKTDETGYIFEPWHYRYVGKELAEKLYNNGDWITMEDYFGIDSEYKY